MIYSFSVRNEFNEEKQFYLTAEDKNKFYRRVLSTYGITKENINILEEFEETDDWGYRLVKSNISHLSDEDKNKAKLALDIFNDNHCKDEPHKTKTIKRCGFDVIDINNEKDIIPLLNKYKTIKVYWEHTDKRGVKKYYVLVK